MGTDTAIARHGTNLRELGLMCDIGMTPMEAIVATTKTAAECLGWEDSVGTLEAGKLADIVIAKTDPLRRHPFPGAGREHRRRHQRRPDHQGSARQRGLA